MPAITADKLQKPDGIFIVGSGAAGAQSVTLAVWRG
jgi:hypothetical protein